MFCNYCGKEIDDDSRFCRHCGKSSDHAPGQAIISAPFPPVERRKRKTSPVAKTVIASFILLIAAILVVVITAPEGPAQSAGPELTDDGQTKIACYCAKSYGDIYPVLNAYRNDDTRAMQGLLIRGNALNLDEGVKVHKLVEDHGVVDVSIESGFHSGESCYVPYRFIQWEYALGK